jgi:Xaa-Pro dipeptidase
MKLERGPHVALALTRANGYAAECERTFFTAPPSAEERDRFAPMQAAREAALRLARPGASCHEIDAAVNHFLADQGCPPAVRLHRTGHGFGLGNHEPPWIAEGSTEVLAANMVISIEPGIYDAGLGGYRHSDTFLVTADGVRAVFVRRALGMQAAPVRGCMSKRASRSG